MSSSDEEEGRIAFTTEGDYDDGQWVGGEFYARGQRRGRHQTKEEAIYGYDDSDDEGYKGGRKKKVSKYATIITNTSSPCVSAVSISVCET